VLSTFMKMHRENRYELMAVLFKKHEIIELNNRLRAVDDYVCEYEHTKLNEIDIKLKKYRAEKINKINEECKTIKNQRLHKLQQDAHKEKNKIKKNIELYNIKLNEKSQNNLLEIGRKLAFEQGGRCLSIKCTSTYDKLKWRCNKNHEFELPLYKVMKRNIKFCNQCIQVNTSENITRAVFESIFDKKFPNTRPDWLINPETNQCLELDGYCVDLKLAFEYNGPHHNMSKTKSRDKLKKELCRINGLQLIVIDYKVKHIKMQVLKECFFLYWKGFIKNNPYDTFNKKFPSNSQR